VASVALAARRPRRALAGTGPSISYVGGPARTIRRSGPRRL